MSREIDIRCAQALGWVRCPCSNPDCSQWHTPLPNREYDMELPRFSTDISAAFQLVAYLTAEDEWGDIKMAFILEYQNIDGWIASFIPQRTSRQRPRPIRGYSTDIPAAAIAAAFLAAMA